MSKRLTNLLAIAVIFSAFSAQAQTKIGQFFGVDPGKNVSGYVKIEGNTLTLDESFKSTSGPDLFIVLHKEVIPKSYNSKNSVYIDRLRSSRGMQDYTLPDGIDVEDYKAVIIYCKKYDVTFGSSQLINE